MAATVDLTGRGLVEGDDIPITFVVTEGGLQFDFSAVTKAWFTAKTNPSDEDSVAKIGPLDSDSHPAQVEYGGTDPGPGRIRVILLSGNTKGLAVHKRLLFDVQVLRSGLITTIVRGVIGFEHEITQAFA